MFCALNKSLSWENLLSESGISKHKGKTKEKKNKMCRRHPQLEDERHCCLCPPADTVEATEEGARNDGAAHSEDWLYENNMF